MIRELGSYNTSSTRTHVRFQFSTHAAAGGNVAPSSAFENADLRIYRANDSAAYSATQRSSAAGITMTSPFDSLTGVHDVDIDLADNTDAGFYAAGYRYSVVLAPDETVDSQTITGVVLAEFEIGPPPANVTQLGGDAQSATDLKDFADAGYDPATNKVEGVKLADTLTTYTGNTVQTGDSYAIVNSGTHGNAAIKGFVDDIGVAGAGLTAIPWNAAWDAEVQSECTDALVAYDGLVAADLPSNFAALSITAGGVVKADLETIKTQTVTCAAGVTFLASVGTATVSTAQTGDSFARIGATGSGLTSLASQASVNAVDDLVDDLESRIGTPADFGGGATIAFNLADIEGQTDDIGVAGAGLTAIPDSAGVTTLLIRIPAALFSGITSLAQWLGMIAGKQTGNSTARTEIRATGAGSGTYDETADSQEAIRDRGDAAWITATGFSTHSAADVWAVGTRVLTAGTNIVLAKGTGVTGFTDIDAAGVRIAVGLASANLDTQLADIPTVAEFEARTIAAASYSTLTTAQVNAEVLDVLNVDTLIDGKTIVQATQYVGAICAGRVSGAGTGTEVFKGLDESTTRVTVTVDGSGNRSDIVYG